MMKDAIKNAALELGFSHVGVARAEALPEAPLLDWLAQGYHGSMGWMARDPKARLDPREIFAGCQTVISLAMNYYTPQPTKSDETHGRISRYARGRDYHKVLRKRLKALAQKIETLAPGTKTKICTDSTPVSEKAWAQRAGIGWQGKHTTLITHDVGSWIFLGEILTDLPLQPDPPHLDFCGSCNRCMEACPTQAITEPYVLDATRCIAYLTIENKTPPPTELASQMGDWIFGCDICQEVCPWNKFSQTTEIADFFPKPQMERPLSDWLLMNEETFFNQFAGTPIMRAKRTHMAENAQVALGNKQTGKGHHS